MSNCELTRTDSWNQAATLTHKSYLPTTSTLRKKIDKIEWKNVFNAEYTRALISLIKIYIINSNAIKAICVGNMDGKTCIITFTGLILEQIC